MSEREERLQWVFYFQAVGGIRFFFLSRMLVYLFKRQSVVDVLNVFVIDVFDVFVIDVFDVSVIAVVSYTNLTLPTKRIVSN